LHRLTIRRAATGIAQPDRARERSASHLVAEGFIVRVLERSSGAVNGESERSWRDSFVSRHLISWLVSYLRNKR
jgi:hypothetical protein